MLATLSALTLGQTIWLVASVVAFAWGMAHALAATATRESSRSMDAQSARSYTESREIAHFLARMAVLTIVIGMGWALWRILELL